MTKRSPKVLHHVTISSLFYSIFVKKSEESKSEASKFMNLFAEYLTPEYLEQADKYRIPYPVFQCLAQTVFDVQRFTGIEPVSLEPLENRAGASCILYGRKYVFRIRVETHFPVPVVCLDQGSLDDPSDLPNIGGGDAENLSNWSLILALILQAEKEPVPA